jgi:MFS transporter, DHA1 family, inner membrane transport protein
MPPALFALFAAAFSIGTSEFVIAGILPAVSGDLHIDIPTAGMLVSIYALGVAVGGPLLAAFTGRFSRRRLLLTYVAIFTIGYVACALAPSFETLLAARAAISLIHGAYFGTALVAASQLVEEKRRGFAISLVLSGLTVANVIGVPLGSAIGNAFGWRMTFWTVAGFGAVSFVLVWLLVRIETTTAQQASRFSDEVRALRREPVLSSFGIILAQTVGQFALFTYIAPLLTGVSGVPADSVPWLLLAFGLGSTVGMLLGGRLADWKLMASQTFWLASQIVLYLLMLLFAANPWAMGTLLLLWGATVFAFAAPAQSRIISSTRDAPTLASSLIPSSFNIAIAAGAWLGGVQIASGLGYQSLFWPGLVGAVIATAISVLSWRRERRAAASN